MTFPSFWEPCLVKRLTFLFQVLRASKTILAKHGFCLCLPVVIRQGSGALFLLTLFDLAVGGQAAACFPRQVELKHGWFLVVPFARKRRGKPTTIPKAATPFPKGSPQQGSKRVLGVFFGPSAWSLLLTHKKWLVITQQHGWSLTYFSRVRRRLQELSTLWLRNVESLRPPLKRG